MKLAHNANSLERLRSHNAFYANARIRGLQPKLIRQIDQHAGGRLASELMVWMLHSLRFLLMSVLLAMLDLLRFLPLWLVA